MQSGAVFTVFSSVNQTNAFQPGTLRADLVGNQPRIVRIGTLSQPLVQYERFRRSRSLQVRHRGAFVLEAPGLVNVDVSFIKVFRFKERYRAELRAEFFNALNRADSGLPAHSVGVANFGIINSAAAGRNTQIAARIEF